MSKPLVKANLVDRFVGFFDPVKGVKRLQARQAMAIVGGYKGARKDRRQTSSWRASDGDADSVILPDLPVLRDRSRDLERNSPLAGGAINTKVTSVVGTGLKPRASIDRDVLAGLTEEQADAWERAAEREFRLATSGKDFDTEKSFSFSGSQDLVFRAVLSSGDILVNLPRKARKGNPYNLRINLVESDRICNEDFKQDTDTLIAGVEKDADGAPVRYHVAKFHPGNYRNIKNRTWMKLDAYDKQGRPAALHLFFKRRPGQTRGVPDLAPVVELIKQLTTYTDNEIMAGVINSLLTVFVKSVTGSPNIQMQPQTGSSSQTQSQINTDGLELGAGSIVGLFPDEDIEIVDGKRPNNAADAFLGVMAEQIGANLEIGKELLLKHFTASYSASRAALLEAWRYFLKSRSWLAAEYCQPIWNLVISDAVAMGRLSAPGFFSDPMVRMAYLGCDWIGDSMGQLNPKVEVDAAAARVENGFSTKAKETAALTGGDWEKDERQRVKESRMEANRTLEETLEVSE